MYDVGTMSRADLAQMQSQLSQQEYDVANSLTLLSQYKLQLKQILRLAGPATGDFDVAAPEIGDAMVMATLPAVDDVYATAVGARPEMRYSRLGVEEAEMDINIARRGYYPTLSMQAGINTSASSGLDYSWANQMKTNLSNQIGLTLSVPIFDNRVNSTNVARARLSKQSSEISLAQQEQTLYNTIENYWLDATNARAQYASAKTNAESMRLSYNLVSEQFAVGLKDIVDLTTGRNNLLLAEQQLLQSKYTALLNRSLLEFYRGLPLSL